MSDTDLLGAVAESASKVAKWLWSGLVQTSQTVLCKAKEVASPWVEKACERATECYKDIDPYIQEGKRFYEANKEIVIIVGVSAVSYWLFRQPKRVEKQHRKKPFNKSTIVASKVFISDDPDQEDETPKGQRERPKKEDFKKGKEVRQSQLGDSKESSREDKLFFEMYRYYQQSD